MKQLKSTNWTVLPALTTSFTDREQTWISQVRTSFKNLFVGFVVLCFYFFFFFEKCVKDFH